MCDIYTAECRGCQKDVEVHIGDYSASRQSVRVYCPDCRRYAMDRLVNGGGYGNGVAYIVFTDSGPGGTYLFLVDMPRGIHLNS